METEELTRLVDGIYKNILDKFNPGARQLINAGKAYLKALHGAAAASRVYVDALSRLARQAQLGTWGGSQDVGSALMRIVEVYKEIQDQEMNILKAFYVDLLVPLETNLEKDTKVVQSEQKKFLQQHKTRSETYSKAAATMKKQRKKSRGASKSGLAMDKELKNMQILEEEKSKLDAFCEQSLKNAMTQERRRYGFVLERQCSLAKHYASFHEVALSALHPSVDDWREIAATREYLPQSVEDMFASRLRQVSFWPEDEENGGSELTMSSQLRKTRSMDSSCLELRLGPPTGSAPSSAHHGGPPHLPPVLSRARSEVNLHASTLSLGPEVPETPPRPRSMAPASRNSGSVGGGGGGGGSTGGGGGSHVGGGWTDTPLARALFAYLSSGENQLSFLEGDLIALMGDRQKGWQFGENLRTQSSGWFPLAYTEIIVDEPGSPNHGVSNGRGPEARTIPPCKPPPSRPPVTPGVDDTSGGSHPGSGGHSSTDNGSATPTNAPSSLGSRGHGTPSSRQSKSVRPSGTLPAALAGGRRVQPPVPPVPPPQAVTSLHSSNDSGFSNEPPVQPDVDYSDDEAMRRRRKPRNDSSAVAGERQKESRREKSPEDWENDSWKTLPRDEKSWQLYRSAMDLWADVHLQNGEKTEPTVPRRQLTNGNRRFEEEAREQTKKRTKDLEKTRQVPNARNKMSTRGSSGVQASATTQRNQHGSHRRGADEDHRTQHGSHRREADDESRNQHGNHRREAEEDHRNQHGTHRRDADEDHRNHRDRRRREEESTTEPEAEDEDDEDEEEEDEEQQEDSYATSGEYSKYYDREGQGEDRKYSPEKSSTEDSEDESTITLPETAGKVEQIAQKLEQTAQKYAREHSPPKFLERRVEKERKEDKATSTSGYGMERERERDRKRYFDKGSQHQQSSTSGTSYERDRERYFEKSPPQHHQQVSSSSSTLGTGYERDRDRYFEKPGQQHQQQASSAPGHRFERPRPPFEDAPERPSFRERRYSDKEEIYAETSRPPREKASPMDKDRGYESNFETKLERSKVIERHGYQRPENGSSFKAERNDDNNNTLKAERKLPRQNSQAPSRVFDQELRLETKSPKLVKRTKSFWRFRRDSDVLEGMALWQHRSLVDIPKTVRKEEGKDEEHEDGSKKQILEDGDRSVGDQGPKQEPKAAERIHVPEKSDSFEEFPTPAERPKILERSEYRAQLLREERSYFVGNISRKAILEKERKRSLEAKRNVEAGKEGNDGNQRERRKKTYGEDDDGLVQNLTETEASDEESTYSCIVVKDQALSEKTLLPRTKLRRDSDRERNTCGPWYDLWGVDSSVKKRKKKK
ncbi:trichohyalin [Orussus abietinus]|uniref:trichohyalin n=1 Tax=Orussus abietinus TaxID=222816 RepID=UPI000625ABE6|nr:trichohyalin [Orussus abietinus]